MAALENVLLASIVAVCAVLFGKIAWDIVQEWLETSDVRRRLMQQVSADLAKIPKTRPLAEVIEELKKVPVEPWKGPVVYRNTTAGQIEVYLSPEAHVAEWVSHELTILRDPETDEVVGFYVSM